ncbi:MAG: metallophosphoesterase [Verrucomicrobia bacterium]|nr:metallophosphoesterase [Verrucomicrobiota bacterium]
MYQGTALGHATEGDVMIRCVNHLGYDAWVAGNHEFDWGIEPFQRAVERSQMPVLAANLRMFGQDPLPYGEAGNGFNNLRPCTIKEVAGIRIGIVGLITTGMFNWFPRDLLRGLEVSDPIAPTRAALRWLREEGRCDAVLLACHMGIRPGRHTDDHANHVVALTREFPELIAVIGAHSHQIIAHETVNNVPYTQASYHGIHAGHLELIFDAETHKLMSVSPKLALMDASIEQDASVLALVGDDLSAIESELDREVGVLTQTLEIAKPAPGRASELELFIHQFMAERLAYYGYAVDAVFHGLLFQREPIQSGSKTIRDMWTIIPFENYIVLADLSPEEILAVVNEDLSRGGTRSLMGLTVDFERQGERFKAVGVRGAMVLSLIRTNA